jgi:hypothetical protein
VSGAGRGGQLRGCRACWAGQWGGSLPLTPHPSSQTDPEVLPSLPPSDWACGTGLAAAAAVQGPQEEVGRGSPRGTRSQEPPLLPGEALTLGLTLPAQAQAGPMLWVGAPEGGSEPCQFS